MSSSPSSGRPRSASWSPSSHSSASSTTPSASSREVQPARLHLLSWRPRAPTDSVSEIYAQTSPGVALISAEGSSGSGGTGSGFLIDGKGHVVTNDHVVEAGRTYTVRFGEDGKALPAKLIGKDASTDLAVLEVDPTKIPAETKPLQLADSSALRPGDEAIAIGSPFGLVRHRDHRHHLRARPRDPVAQRLPDLRRAADRRRDQPRQLRRPAARRRAAA